MENKIKWVEGIETLLRTDKRSYITYCKYIQKPDYELVEIMYKDGTVTRVNVTANSLGAILKEVVSEVYGSGSFGRCYMGHCPIDYRDK